MVARQLEPDRLALEAYALQRLLFDQAMVRQPRPSHLALVFDELQARAVILDMLRARDARPA